MSQTKLSIILAAFVAALAMIAAAPGLGGERYPSTTQGMQMGHNPNYDFAISEPFIGTGMQVNKGEEESVPAEFGGTPDNPYYDFATGNPHGDTPLDAKPGEGAYTGTSLPLEEDDTEALQ